MITEGLAIRHTENIITYIDMIETCNIIHVPFYNAHSRVIHSDLLVSTSENISCTFILSNVKQCKTMKIDSPLYNNLCIKISV